MENLLRRVIFLIIVVSIVTIFLAAFVNQGMWWDEAVYLGLGRNIGNGFYSLERGEMTDTFRPPFFPLLIFPFSESVFLARMAVAIFSVFAVLATYCMARELLGKDGALLAALFLSTNQLFVFFSTKILSESLFITFLSLSLLFFLRRARPMSAFASGVFAAAALMTRYLGTILALSYALWFIWSCIRKRDQKTLREAGLVTLGFVISILPWLAMSQIYYGSVLGAYLDNLATYSGAFSTEFSLLFQDVYSVFGFQIIFVIIGLYAFIKAKKSAYGFLLACLFLLPLVFFFMAFHREPRYLLSYMPVYAIFCGKAVEFKRIKIGKKSVNSARYLASFAIIVCIAALFTGASNFWNDRLSGENLVQASYYLKNMTSNDSVIMTESRPYIFYFAERGAVRFPEKREDIGEIIKEYNVKFILAYKFEPGNPPYVADYFRNSPDFKLVKSYEQWGDPEAVRIYRAIR